MADLVQIGSFSFVECDGWRDRRDALLRQCVLNGDVHHGRYSSRLQKGRRHEHVAVSAVFAADGAVISHAEIESFVREQMSENTWIMNQGSFLSLRGCSQLEQVDGASWRCLALSSHLDAHWSVHWRTVLSGTFHDDRAAFAAAINEGRFIAFQFVPGTRGWTFFSPELADRSIYRWTRLIYAPPARAFEIAEDAKNIFLSILRNTVKRKRSEMPALEDKKRKKKKVKLSVVTKN